MNIGYHNSELDGTYYVFAKNHTAASPIDIVLANAPTPKAPHQVYAPSGAFTITNDKPLIVGSINTAVTPPDTT